MVTSDTINSVIDAILTRVTTNITTLGGTATSPVIEGDEMPERITIFPSIFVIPLIEGGDIVTTHMGGIKNIFHEFSVSIVGIYRASTVSELLRTTRNYGYAALDLFSGPINYKVVGTGCGAVLVEHKLEVSYHRVGDRIIHVWILKMTAKTVTS
jgi:hypothetical protein